MSEIKEKKQTKEALFHVVKRKELAGRQATMLRLLALVLALIAGGLFILVMGKSPIGVYATMISGAFRSKMAVQAMVRIMIPLLLTSLGVTLAFKMRFWNIGAEGQLIMGAVFASYFGLFHSDWPAFVLIPVMFVAGVLGGGLFGLLPAIFKMKFGTNETLFTLMLNYIALYIVVYLEDRPWRDPASPGYAKFAMFGDNAMLGKVLGIQCGWIIALILLVVVAVYMKFTKQGYEISVVGESEATARYAGMNVKKIVLRTMFMSGAVSGIAGFVQASGTTGTLSQGIANGVGFTAIIVAWLGRLNPVSIFIITFLFAVMEKGSSVVRSTYDLSEAFASVLQGIILFFVIGCEFFIRYKIMKRKKEGKK